MATDEEQIRQLVSTWHSATKSGDAETVLGLMADDVVFLRPGCPPMRKAEFAAASRLAPGTDPPKIDATTQIQEIQVAGDWAFMWAQISVRMTPVGADQSTERAGHTLTVFHRIDGQWLLARDANLLGPVSQSK